MDADRRDDRVGGVVGREGVVGVAGLASGLRGPGGAQCAVEQEVAGMRPFVVGFAPQPDLRNESGTG